MEEEKEKEEEEEKGENKGRKGGGGGRGGGENQHYWIHLWEVFSQGQHRISYIWGGSNSECLV